MADQMEDRLRALELLQHEGVPLTPYDFGVLAAVRRAHPDGLAARVDAVLRVEASRARKRAAKKPVRVRRTPSVFDRQPDDDDGNALLP